MTNAELVILSLVSEQPRHGYQIEQVIEEREMREWTELGFSSIYYLLNKLEDQGLITGELVKVSGRGPARKVYTITEIGLETCQDGIHAALSEPPRPESMFLLGMSNLPSVPSGGAISALRNYAATLSERQEHLQARLIGGRDYLPFHVEAMFDFSLTMIQAELAWIENFINELEARDG